MWNFWQYSLGIAVMFAIDILYGHIECHNHKNAKLTQIFSFLKNSSPLVWLIDGRSYKGQHCNCELIYEGVPSYILVIWFTVVLMIFCFISILFNLVWVDRDDNILLWYIDELCIVF